MGTISLPTEAFIRLSAPLRRSPTLFSEWNTGAVTSFKIAAVAEDNP